MLTPTIADDLPARKSREAAYSKRMVIRCALLFAFSLFGYPVVGSVISLLQIDSRSLSVPFRIGVGLFGVYVILTSRRLKIDRLHHVMLFICHSAANYKPFSTDHNRLWFDSRL